MTPASILVSGDVAALAHPALLLKRQLLNRSLATATQHTSTSHALAVSKLHAVDTPHHLQHPWTLLKLLVVLYLSALPPDRSVGLYVHHAPVL